MSEEILNDPHLLPDEIRMKILQWGEVSNRAMDISEELSELIISHYQTRVAFDVNAEEIKAILFQSLDAERKKIMDDSGAILNKSVKLLSPDEKTLKKKREGVLRRVRALYVKLRNEVYGLPMNAEVASVTVSSKSNHSCFGCGTSGILLLL